MPEAFGIVDTHLHIWDPGQLTYPWHKMLPQFDRPMLLDDYRAACGDIAVDAMVFIECFAERSLCEDEVRFADALSKADPRIKAIVMQAGVDDGDGIRPLLERMTRQTPLLRGVRRAVTFEPDADVLLRPGIVAGVRALADYDLSFEITASHRQIAHVPEFADKVGDIQLILDHCGKPAIREGLFAEWRENIMAIARCPNVVCKVSDLPGEADHANWTAEQLRPHVDTMVEAFGFGRLVYGGDWPVCTLATSLRGWKSFLDDALVGASEADRTAFYRNNAIDVYRLDLAKA